MTPYEQLLKQVLETGTPKSDRTGTGTRALFGAQMRFNLAEGFPLITTKKVHFKSVVGELLWFLSGSTNADELRDKYGVTIWEEWKGPDGSLGPVYAASWRHIYAPSNELVTVPVRSDSYASFEYPFETELLPAIECDLNSDEVWAVEDLGSYKRNRRYRIQLRSGFVCEIQRGNWRAVRSLSSIDGYARTVAGVGFRGKPVPVDDRLYTLWYNMIRRCYDPGHPNFEAYGGRGVSVSPIWHSYEYFVRTIDLVPGYHLWSAGEDLDLDKDYFGSTVYGPSTCLFLGSNHNVGMRRDGSAVQIEGTLYPSYKAWARGDRSAAWYARSRWKAGKSYKGISAESVREVQPPEGKLYRNRMFFDQVTDLVESLRSNPDSRRHILNAWHVPLLGRMALPPCHALVQFDVTDGKLSCQLYQRSADMFLGVPFNIASYALLTHMVAQQTGLEVGDFVWTGGSVHLYDNHIEQATLQLTREPRPWPTLKLTKRESIFDYTPEDIVLEGYDPHPGIKAQVAV